MPSAFDLLRLACVCSATAVSCRLSMTLNNHDIFLIRDKQKREKKKKRKKAKIIKKKV